MLQTGCVLVVDDDSTMRDMLVSLLEDHGFQARAAASAEGAVAKVRETEFDAVVSDIKMPGLSGLELLGELREFRVDLPVILMTGFGSIDSAVEAMRAGAFDYITKPFKRDEVLVVLERALEEENRQAAGGRPDERVWGSDREHPRCARSLR
jgi:DNA-binding NtrC family response regulator